MYILITFAFLAGIITMLSPCILPVLPIVLSGSTIGNKKYPLGIIFGFIISFTVFTLFLTTLVNVTGISVNFLRYFSIAVIFIFGLVLVVPSLKKYYELLISKLQNAGAKKTETKDTKSEDAEEKPKKKTGFFGGFLVGTSLGLVWTPCVGPILASVIALALSGAVSGTAVLVTLAYATGTALPMMLIMYGGRGIFHSIPWLLNNLENIQKIFGVLLLAVAVAILFNLDRQFQIYILEKFPNYGAGLTQIEENDDVLSALDETFNPKSVQDDDMIGKPTFEMNKSMFKDAPELIPGGKWFNSDPLTLEQLKGKVVLIDFWTYSCINCIRTLPYIQSWHGQYEDDGLVIIGVHTPEFEFEKDPDNLAKAIQDFGLTYPIVQDNEFKTWRAYSNRYWPAKYFIDHEGKIRDMHFGEGEYEESEQTIRELLEEAGMDVAKEKVEVAEYDVYSRTHETYLGYKRISNFASPEKIAPDKANVYSAPLKIPRNNVAYKGEWTVKDELANPSQNAELILNFESKEVYLVMSPINDNVTGEVEVYLDNRLVGTYAGDDAIGGTAKIDTDRLYRLINLEEPGRHLLRLKFLDSNTEVYAFTFG